MTTALGLLKKGKLILRRTSDRSDLMKFLGEWYEKFDLVTLTRKFVSTEPRNPLGTRKHLVTDRGDLISILKTRHGLNNLSLEIIKTELELSVVSRSFVNRANDQVRKRQKNFECHRRLRKTFYDLENVYGCNTWNQQYSWERITRTFVTPLWTRQTSHWNKRST